MKRTTLLMNSGTVAAISAALLLSLVASHSAQAQLQPLPTRHTRDAVTQKQVTAIQRLDRGQVMQLGLALKLRDRAGLEAFLGNLYNPSSPNYGKYLSVQEFANMFGPSEADQAAVLRFAAENGFTVIRTDANRMLVQIDASVESIEKAFHVTMNVYQHPTENRTFYAPDREPTVDRSIPLWSISGLDNYSTPRSLASQGVTPSPLLSGSGPGGQFLGSDMRAAYYGAGPLTGAGQSIGLLEFVGYDPFDPQNYFDLYGPPLTATITPVQCDNSQAVCTTCEDAEQALDIEQAISMAPGIDECLVYVGQTDAVMLNRMASDNVAKSIGCSWSWRPADPATDDPIFLEFAAQGQTFFTAAGDSGAWNAGTLFSWPADDQNVVSVGGTHLVTDGAGGPWQSETAWADSGGGISLNGVAIPDWQKNRKVVNHTNSTSRTLRNAPDIAAEADFDNWICADNTCNGTWGGTSFAAPRWAGYIALANQKAVQLGESELGFINPRLYQAAEGRYANNFHDITVGSNGYPAVTGFDLVTGWGSMNGPTLINTLLRP